MTESKMTPKQTVQNRVPTADRYQRPDGRHEIMSAGERIGDSSKTPAGAWKNAADHLALLDAKMKQAEDFNRMASKPTDPPPAVDSTVSNTMQTKRRAAFYDDKPAPTITPKEKAKRRQKNKQARQARKMNRRRAA